MISGDSGLTGSTSGPLGLTGVPCDDSDLTLSISGDSGLGGEIFGDVTSTGFTSGDEDLTVVASCGLMLSSISLGSTGVISSDFDFPHSISGDFILIGAISSDSGLTCLISGDLGLTRDSSTDFPVTGVSLTAALTGVICRDLGRTGMTSPGSVMGASSSMSMTGVACFVMGVAWGALMMASVFVGVAYVGAASWGLPASGLAGDETGVTSSSPGILTSDPGMSL